MLTTQDTRILQQRGISVSQIDAQLERLRQGMAPINLVRPCRLGDGILQLPSGQIHQYQHNFEEARQANRTSKFVPASGAATRMFKDLLQCLQDLPPDTSSHNNASVLPEGVNHLLTHIQDFPFHQDLQDSLRTQGQDIHATSWQKILQTLLSTPGLDYANLPKAQLPFHVYGTGARTALEEHIYEALLYLKDSPGRITIHLTVSPQYENTIKAKLQHIQHTVNKEDVSFDLTVSTQKPSTDTVSLDSQDQLFRTDDGTLMFRPGGHGALLENLNDYEGDIVFISNIDNVVPDHLKRKIIEWRSHLAGYLLEYQQQVFHHIQQLASAPDKPDVVREAEGFLQQDLQYSLPKSYNHEPLGAQADTLKAYLHRPIRVCGVVANTGDPGGGPFWVQHPDGTCSRQIVEQSQVDSQSESQQQLFASSSHFNPVDLVCGVRDYQGKPFNLLNFVDDDTGFISMKSFQGRPLKALEWPGLWNGGMAKWITLFVEIPRSNFNPVKTYLDWLHPNHQPPTGLR